MLTYFCERTAALYVVHRNYYSYTVLQTTRPTRATVRHDCTDISIFNSDLRVLSNIEYIIISLSLL